MNPNDPNHRDGLDGAAEPAPMWHGVSDPTPLSDGAVLPSAYEAALARDPLRQQARTLAAREARQAWAANVRDAVRSNPLSFLAGALALGMIVARIKR